MEKGLMETVSVRGFHCTYMLCAVHLKAIKGIFLSGQFPWCFSVIGQYTLESLGADGERIRRDKGRAPGANPHEGLKTDGHFMCDLCIILALYKMFRVFSFSVFHQTSWLVKY